jgi:T3SS negative regulator,GrlR
VQGLWTIEFGSSAGIYGTGVLVLREGKIQGGDASYYYDGSYEETSPTTPYPSTFKAKIAVKPFLPNAESIFRTYGEDFTLDFEGTLKDENNAVAIGRPEEIPNMDVGIRMTRRSEAT